MAKLAKLLKGNDKKNLLGHACGLRLKAHLDALKPARSFVIQEEDEKEYLKSLHLITLKPVLYAANVAENELATDAANNPHVKVLKDIAHKEGSRVVVV